MAQGVAKTRQVLQPVHCIAGGALGSAKGIRTAAAAATSRRRDYGAAPQGKPMSKREERLLHESGRLLTVPPDSEQPNGCSAQNGVTSRDCAAGDDLAKTWENEEGKNVLAFHAGDCLEAQHDTHDPAQPSAPRCEVKVCQILAAGPQAESTAEVLANGAAVDRGSLTGCSAECPANVSKRAQLTMVKSSSGPNERAVVQDGQSSSSSKAAVQMQNKQRTQSEQPGMQTELRQLEELFSEGCPLPKAGPFFSQDQADLALAARLQEEELRAHKKRAAPVMSTTVVKKKPLKVKTLDAFVRRTA